MADIWLIQRRQKELDGYNRLSMIKVAIVALLLALAIAQTELSSLNINYPLYKQCDAKWAKEQLGTSSNTICSAGCLMSSSAMALYAAGNTQINPSTLNKWLTANGGYVQGDLYVWASVNRMGVTFQGFLNNNDIKKHIDAGHIVILNVHNGGHWVLATGYNGDSILVNDPGYSVSSYTLNQIVNGNTGYYTINKMPNFLTNWFISISQFFTSLTSSEKELEFPPVKVPHEQGNIRVY